MHDIENYHRSGSLRTYVLRVGVARALIGQPALILADEPTGNLNSRQGEEVMDMLRELNDEGTTIVQVTHSEKNAGYGSRVVHLLDGRMEREGRC